MSSEMSVQEQILALKMMTAQTGVLHEAQVLQLKLWPWTVFPKEITSYEIGVQPDPDKKYLEYRMIGHDKIKALPKKGVVLLQSWVKNLLGQDWTVVVKFNGSEVKVNNGRTGKRQGTRRKGRRR